MNYIHYRARNLFLCSGPFLAAVALSVTTAAAQTTHLITTLDHDGDAIPSGAGADSYIVASDAERDFAATNFGSEEQIYIKADRPHVTGTTRKAYLRFDLSVLPDHPVTEAELRLIYFVNTNNAEDGEYRLRLWGLAHDAEGQDWAEVDDYVDEQRVTGITWVSAPGNDIESPTDMGDDAVLLAEITLPAANPARGSEVLSTNADSVEENGFADFLSADDDGLVTLMITAEVSDKQKTGFRFAAKESTRYDPPQLKVTVGENEE